MKKYSFLIENHYIKHVGSHLKNIHFGNGYAFVDNYDQKNDVKEFIASLLTCNTLAEAISLYKKEKTRFFTNRLPSKYLESIGRILNTSTDLDFKMKLEEYYNITFN